MGFLVQALLEPGHIHSHRLRMTAQVRRSESLLVSEEPVMHLPVLPLVAGTAGSLSRLERQWMDRLEGIVPKDVLHLAGLDVLGYELRQGLADMAAAERALVV